MSVLAGAIVSQRSVSKALFSPPIGYVIAERNRGPAALHLPEPLSLTCVPARAQSRFTQRRPQRPLRLVCVLAHVARTPLIVKCPGALIAYTRASATQAVPRQ